ncbi:MAG TPA: aromatic amino acid aminotransferase, partial [Gammaproteobacteria bacterium]|nr:aromatic amino acid aminotransferase [Gammaproteobacteria bacterium]
MLDQLQRLPDDPILGLVAQAAADHNPQKVDLTIGIYMDENGLCPVFDAVQRAQQQLIAAESTKAYLPAVGDAA